MQKQHQKVNRQYPEALITRQALQKVAEDDIHMRLPPGYHYQKMSAKERKLPKTVTRLSHVCSQLIATKWSKKHLRDALKFGNVITISTVSTNQVVAFIIYKTRGPQENRTHFIDLICTKSTHQGKGLASILIKHAITLFVRTAPRADIFLKTWGDKGTYYNKFGFSRVQYAPPHADSSISITKRNTSLTSTNVRLYYMRFVRGKQHYINKVKKLVMASMRRQRRRGLRGKRR